MAKHEPMTAMIVTRIKPSIKKKFMKKAKKEKREPSDIMRDLIDGYLLIQPQNLQQKEQ